MQGLPSHRQVGTKAGLTAQRSDGQALPDACALPGPPPPPPRPGHYYDYWLDDKGKWDRNKRPYYLQVGGWVV